MPVLRKKCSLIRLTKIPPVNRLPESPPLPNPAAPACSKRRWCCEHSRHLRYLRFQTRTSAANARQGVSSHRLMQRLRETRLNEASKSSMPNGTERYSLYTGHAARRTESEKRC